MFYRKWKVKNVVVLDVQSATHLEAFLIKQGVLFFARLQCFMCAQRHALAIACLVCQSLFLLLHFPYSFFLLHQTAHSCIVGTPLERGGGGLSFWSFQKWGDSDFSHKKGGVGKMGGCFKKVGLLLIFILTNPFQCYLSLSVWCVCVCVLFIYTSSISII